MTAAEDKVAGFALAALLDGDRDAGRVAGTVAAPFHAAVRAQLGELGAGVDKRAALGQLIARVRPEPTREALAALPGGVQALLAAPSAKRRPRALGRDHDVDPDLVALLRRVATRVPA